MNRFFFTLWVALGLPFTLCATNGLPNTTVQLESSSYSTTETAGSITIPVSITNPHPTLATTVQLVLTSGTASAINNYTTQTITFPAASVTSQNVTITITNNSTCEIQNAHQNSIWN